MKARNLALIGMCCLGALSAGNAARAAQVIYDGTGFLQGDQSFTDTFNVSGPGTLTVTLTNVAWPVELASLNMVLGTAKGLMGPEMGAGSHSFKIGSAQKIFAQWFGSAQGPFDVGVYSMKITFRPQGEAVVPLPASVALLASGFALLGFQRRQRAARGLLPAVQVG